MIMWMQAYINTWCVDNLPEGLTLWFKIQGNIICL